MPAPNRINVSFRLDGKRFGPMPFVEGVKLVASRLEAERSGFVTIQSQVRADNYLQSFFSDLLVHLEPPTPDDWSKPQRAHEQALNLYNAGDDHDRQAMRALGEAVEAYNDVRRKFWRYREAIGTGGERVITTLEVSMMLLGAAFGAGVGLAGASYVGGSLLSAGLTMAQATASNAASVHWGLQQEFNIGDVVVSTAASFVSSLISGKLAEKFAGALARRAMLRMFNRSIPYQLSFREIVHWAEAQGVPLMFKATAAQEFMAAFVASFGADRLLDQVVKAGKAIKKYAENKTLEQFLDGLANDVIGVFEVQTPGGFAGAAAKAAR